MAAQKRTELAAEIVAEAKLIRNQLREKKWQIGKKNVPILKSILFQKKSIFHYF